MTSSTINESPREAALREAARELVAASKGVSESMRWRGTASQSPQSFARLQDAMAKMEEVL